MSTPNHEFPSGDQPQGSGQSPQMPAGIHTLRRRYLGRVKTYRQRGILIHLRQQCKLLSETPVL